MKPKRNRIVGAFLMLTLFVSTAFWGCLLHLCALLKLVPSKAIKRLSHRGVNKLASLWVATNILFVRRFLDTQWQINMPSNFSLDDWYLIIANHQCWLDIVVLQTVFHKKTPFLKFFVKNQLKWVPLLGTAWWAMGYPFMKRHSKQAIAKNPQLKQDDLNETRKRCRQFTKHPTSILNFVEGTRFTKQKQQQKKSPYRHLLPPKAGGLRFTLACMPGRFEHLTDVTIQYPHGVKSLWQFLCNEVALIRVDIQRVALPQSDNTASSEQNTADFHLWLNQHWQHKDNLLDQTQ